MTETPSDPSELAWWYRSPSGEIYGPYDDVEFDRYAKEGRFDPAGGLRHGEDPSPWESVDFVMSSQVTSSPSGTRPETTSQTTPPLERPVESAAGISSVSRVVFILTALLPGVVLSVFGIHNLIAGYTGKGVTQLVLSLVVVWGMGCVSILLPPSICLSVVVWIGLLIWSIVEACTVTHDEKGRRFAG